MQLHNRAIGYFDAVRRFGSIREAARRLNVAASAVNRHILKFEADLGMPLFDRLPNGMALTPAGEVLARHAITVLQDEHRTSGELDGLRGLKRGKLTVVAVESLNAALLPNVIERMRSKYPGIQITVQTSGSNAIPAAIAAGDADIGLAYSLEYNPELRQLAVGRFRLGAVMPPDHALAGEAHVTMTACMRFPVILPTRELSIFNLIEPQLRRFRDRIQIVAEVGSLELMRNLSMRLGAISFQARVGLENDIRQGRLVHIPVHTTGPITTELGIYVRQGRPLPVAVDVFIALVRDEIAAVAAEDSGSSLKEASC